MIKQKEFTINTAFKTIVHLMNKLTLCFTFLMVKLSSALVFDMKLEI